jgi:ubiquitin carboxyl-terminal hydrolase 7
MIRNNMAARQNDLRLYLDIIPDPAKAEIPAGHIMIFLKHFDTSKQTLYGVGKLYVSRSAKVSDLYPLINERMRWAPETPLKLYEVSAPANNASRP